MRGNNHRGQSNFIVNKNSNLTNKQNNYDSDNQSVHSVNSRKSKGKAK